MLLRQNRTATWLAILAVALNALWPLISQAQPREHKLYATVCSVQGGVHTVELAGGKAPADDSAGKHQKHCKLCVGGNDRLQALPTAPFQSFQSPACAADLAAAAPAAAARTTSALPAQPRAPPVQI